MNRKLLFMLVLTALVAAACGGAGDSTTGTASTAAKPEITAQYESQEKKFEPTSNWAYHSTKTFTEPVDGKSVMTTSSITTIVLANFELDTKQAFITLGKQKLSDTSQIKVMLGFTGAQDTKVETAIKTGEYMADADKYNKVETPTIFYFADGQQKSIDFDRNTMKGKLNITEVNGSTIKGEIDVTDGKNSLKGNFVANGHKSVK